MARELRTRRGPGKLNRRKRKSPQTAWIIALAAGLGGLLLLGLVLAFTLGRGNHGDDVQSSSESKNGLSLLGGQSEAPAGWKVVSEPKYGVEVMMPNPPQHPVDSIIEDARSFYVSHSNDGVISYSILSKRIGHVAPENRQAELSKLVDARLQGWAGARILGRWWISLGDSPGVAVHVSGTNAQEKFRFFLIGDRQISQTIYVESGPFDTESTRRFFDSLRVDGLSVTQSK